MKAVIKAKPLAAALNLASALAADSKLVKRIPALGAAYLVAKAEAVSVTANNLDHVLTLSIPATVESPGELAISASRLAGLASSFPPHAEIAISADDKAAAISCGRSRFRLPTLPLGDLPPMPEIADETGRVELAREELLGLLSRPGFAISAEETRYYLNGILLHDTGGGLAAVATDGHRLARAVLPGAGLSQDRRLIIPRPAIRIVLKLLGDKAIELLTLRRSATLIEIAGAKFTFISKLIDGTYPAYECVVPEPSGNTAVVDRAALAQAVARIAAVTPDDQRLPLIGLTWKSPGPLRLCIPGAPDLADDPIGAVETSGRGRIAVQIRHLAQLFDEFGSERVRIDAGNSAGAAIRITDPDDADFLCVQMPCVWGAETSQAA
jgi:DNA polymerase-3 subunit beta